MIFSEDSRIKIPCILHLVRLGYRYLSLKNAVWDEGTNIFPDLFRTAIKRINPGIEDEDANRLLADVKLSLENEDLGKAFYEKLTERSGTLLIDFANFANNSFHVVTELTCKNGDDEFRPDITLLINGMPLIFIEVKKPNNREGVLAERNRIITRSQNPRFRRFINITQLMVFSNNMEYDDGSPEPVEGAFYASSSYDKPTFNYFREEEKLDLTKLLADEDDALENEVLRDNNLNVIKHSPEFISNKSPNTPTNRLCTSLFSQDRLSFLLQYSLAYVKEVDGLQKHVMRYPQLFATKAIEQKLNAGVRNGIIWHTQGSGKTALAYFNTRFLTDYFQHQGIISKFYFIVDRLDLLTQATREFTCRGLQVHTIDSREAFARDIKATKAVHNHSGRPEITVVNIQKFQDDPDVVRTEDYDTRIQRIYFLDEVHRSYNPKGSFLANLSQSDTNAIKIGLTGTPLLGDDYSSRILFGNYIHKYYYNASIADGYLTMVDLFRTVISAGKLEEMLTEVGSRFSATSYIGIGKDAYKDHESLLSPLGFEWNKDEALYLIAWTEALENLLIQETSVEFDVFTRKPYRPEQRDRFDSIQYWYWEHWKFFRSEVKTSIVQGIAVFLSLFETDPDVRRVFCPPKDLYDGKACPSDPQGIVLAPFGELIESGAVVGLNFPVALNPALAKTIGTMMKIDYQRAVQLRIPKMDRHPERYFRPTVFICDEYQNFATVGGDNPTGDERFLSLSRQPKCIPIVATQSISSLKDALPNEGVKTLLQAFRTKVFLTTSDPETARYASELCGKADRTRISYAVSESSTNANVGWLSGRTASSKGSVSASKQYQKHKEPLFEEKVFFDLKNAQSVVVAFDGVSPLPPTYCYLKPDFLPVKMSWFEQERIAFDPERIPA